MSIQEQRVAIVTGAGRGIGREHALALAERGFAVVVNDLGADPHGTGADSGPAGEVAAQIVSAGGRAVVDGGDVSNWSDAEALIGRALSEFGRLDVLVNNAGILRDRTIAAMTAEEWDIVVQVHLRGTFAPTHFAVQYWRSKFKESGVKLGARLINTTSASGIYGNFGQANYGAPKAGIAAFTVIAAKELAPYGVTANAVSPAALTRLTEGLLDPEAPAAIPGPEHIARVVAWLAGPASESVTGRVLDVAGSRIGVSEMWRLGPTATKEGIWEVDELDDVIPDLVAQAAPNVGLDGVPLTVEVS